MTHDWAMIRLLACSAIAVGSQSAMSVRAESVTALDPWGLNTIAPNSRAPRPGEAGALGSSVQVTGDSGAMRLEVRQSSLVSVLAALAAAYPVSYRSEIELNELCDCAYAGSLHAVITGLLGGYDYVIKENRDKLEILILGKSGKQALRAPTAEPIHRIPVTTRISRTHP